VHEFFLNYRRYRHLKLSFGFLGLTMAAYGLYEPIGGHSGGSWFGYGLGTIAAAMILWLAWFGARKRKYDSTGAPLRGWLSAHVYWGATLLLLVPLHAAFQFGFNIHTLAYLLMAAVIVSGFVGVLLYSNLPQAMTENRPDRKLEALLQETAEIDNECGRLANDLPDALAHAAMIAVQETKIGGGVFRQLSGTDPHCGTSRAFDLVRKHEKEVLGTQQEDAVIKLIEVLARKRELLRRIRQEIRFKALLEIWLTVHVPLTFATIALVATHVVVVLMYR